LVKSKRSLSCTDVRARLAHVAPSRSPKRGVPGASLCGCPRSRYVATPVHPRQHPLACLEVALPRLRHLDRLVVTEPLQHLGHGSRRQSPSARTRACPASDNLGRRPRGRTATSASLTSTRRSPRRSTAPTVVACSVCVPVNSVLEGGRPAHGETFPPRAPARSPRRLAGRLLSGRHERVGAGHPSAPRTPPRSTPRPCSRLAPHQLQIDREPVGVRAGEGVVGGDALGTGSAWPPESGPRASCPVFERAPEFSLLPVAPSADRLRAASISWDSVPHDLLDGVGVSAGVIPAPSQRPSLLDRPSHQHDLPQDVPPRDPQF